MVHKHFARLATFIVALVSALSLSTALAPAASANWPNPEPGLTYHWSAVKTWTPAGTQADCQYRNGWANVDSNTLRFRYEINCDTRAISLGVQYYIQRNTTSIVDQDNTKVCYDTHFCAMARNISNPSGTQTWYSSASWAWTSWDKQSPFLRQVFDR